MLVAARLQPNSSSNGTTITPKDERNAADAMRTQNVTAATHQARWMRCVIPEA